LLRRSLCVLEFSEKLLPLSLGRFPKVRHSSRNLAQVASRGLRSSAVADDGRHVVERPMWLPVIRGYADLDHRQLGGFSPKLSRRVPDFERLLVRDIGHPNIGEILARQLRFMGVGKGPAGIAQFDGPLATPLAVDDFVAPKRSVLLALLV
jgi:hypothetical protein